MKIINNIKEIRKQVKDWKNDGLSIALVPTMGYLHEGHESLIKKASEDNDKVIVSIFVNPMQFGINEDLSTYPRNIDRDSDICEKNGASLIFNPSVEEMYTDGFSTFVDLNNLTSGLCGKSRPTHFRGVCTVVSKLFNIVNPDKAYFGQKDAQQLSIIKQMVTDLNFDIEIVSCPIVREADGLAKSSRNTYLSKEERQASTIINKSLKKAKTLIKSGERDSKNVIDFIKNEINKEPLAKIDYVSIVDNNTIKNIKTIEDGSLIAVAVFIGNTRLIDNFIF
ncbi:pantoate--beta-alanine ligase [Paraclostridium bifermentans]|uniref:pantoate--beta-alanine ligase n=1 Tax=Paraclostridium bifermentans TaxID=1490 RepID=UPI0003FA7B1F|nr:pantoate--beta-alanine ligase [Paraclostridium bifermentans]MDV8110584.1 pantoate--beta-alanine ligase [Bacillus sp. BAU-SS-2023]TQO57904.1 pantoate--beta-alanine ligase [Paraclostridium bifermentans]GKZ03227.1 pantothenate synthetase [Paraclostridium bifermentans]GKZ07021.1 pantothenate synthetase [Paraclostridium bifermentans]GKZ09334.1 pantothenate synthetase [Paraclostridium bifermentans]